MTRADLEAAAEEKYGPKSDPKVTKSTERLRAERRKAYIQGRLDQAEADAQIAEAETPWSIMGHPEFDQKRVMASSIATERERIAAEIRKGVE